MTVSASHCWASGWPTLWLAPYKPGQVTGNAGSAEALPPLDVLGHVDALGDVFVFSRGQDEKRLLEAAPERGDLGVWQVRREEVVVAAVAELVSSGLTN